MAAFLVQHVHPSRDERPPPAVDGRALRSARSRSSCSAAAVAGRRTPTRSRRSADSGGGTLRQAILDANAKPGADTIVFNIAGRRRRDDHARDPVPGHHGRVTIDGSTQAGVRAPTRTPSDRGWNTVLTIEVAGGAVLSPLEQHDDPGPLRSTAEASPSTTAPSRTTSWRAASSGTDVTGTQRLDGGFGTQVTVTGESAANVRRADSGGAKPGSPAASPGITFAGAGTGSTVL